MGTEGHPMIFSAPANVKRPFFVFRNGADGPVLVDVPMDRNQDDDGAAYYEAPLVFVTTEWTSYDNTVSRHCRCERFVCCGDAYYIERGADVVADAWFKALAKARLLDADQTRILGMLCALAGPNSPGLQYNGPCADSLATLVAAGYLAADDDPGFFKPTVEGMAVYSVLREMQPPGSSLTGTMPIERSLRPFRVLAP